MRRSLQRSKISNRSTRRESLKPKPLSTWDGFEPPDGSAVPSPGFDSRVGSGTSSQRHERRGRSEVPLKLAVVGLIAAAISNPLFWSWLSSKCGI